MSEIVIFVETVTSSGWLFLCALAVLSLGLLAFDRQPQQKSQRKVQDVAQPQERRAA